jgi:hypothetical protein
MRFFPAGEDLFLQSVRELQMQCCLKITTLFVLLLAIGCGPGYDVVQVSGTITLDGKPLNNATILTQPIGTKEDTTPGPGSGSVTDEDGHFQLSFQHEEVDGAVPGDAWIKIVENPEKKASSDDSAEVVRSKVPLDYQEGNKVKYTIPEEGTDAMNFELKSVRRRR